MAYVIHKYDVPSSPESFVLNLPPDAKVLDVQLQGEKPQIWVLTETESPYMPRTFFVVATGMEFECKLTKYIGTFQHGRKVWHLFEDFS